MLAGWVVSLAAIVASGWYALHRMQDAAIQNASKIVGICAITSVCICVVTIAGFVFVDAAMTRNATRNR